MDSARHEQFARAFVQHQDRVYGEAEAGGTQVLYLDPRGFLHHEIVVAGRSVEEPGVAAELAQLEQASRQVHHALAEFDVRTCAIPPAVPLGEVLVG